MKFSPQGEKILKEFFSTQKKTQLLDEVEESITGMEADLMKILKSDYSQLIDECSWIEEIKEKIKDIRLVNLDVTKIANDLVESLINNQKDESDLERCKERVELCKRELRNIEGFLEMLLEVDLGIKDLEDFNKLNQIQDLSISSNRLEDIEQTVSSNESKSIEGGNNSKLSESIASSKESGNMKPISNSMKENSISSTKDSNVNSINDSFKSNASSISDSSKSHASSKSDSSKSSSSINDSSKSNASSKSDSSKSSSSNSSQSTSKETVSSSSHMTRNSLSRAIESHSSQNENQSFSKRGQNDVAYFRMATKLLKMKTSVDSISKYFFHSNFKGELEALNDRYKSVLFSQIKNLLMLDWASIGSSVKLSKSICVFDEINSLEFLPKKSRVAIFCIVEINLIEAAIKFIDEVRKTNFTKTKNEYWMSINSEMSRLCPSGNQPSNSNGTENIKVDESLIQLSDKLLNFYIGTIVLSNILLKYFQGLYTFYPDIFTDLYNLKFYSPSSISRLRNIVIKLKIDNPSFNSAIENLVFKYFDNAFKHPDILKYKKEEIFQNIQKCISFISEINIYKGEFDELFIRKVDDSFIFLLNNTPIDLFFSRVDEINEFNETLGQNEIFQNSKFDYVNEIDRSIQRLCEKEVEDIAVFSKNKTTEEIVKRLIKVNQVPSQAFKNKFSEIFEKKATQMYSSRSKEDQALIINTVHRNLLKK